MSPFQGYPSGIRTGCSYDITIECSTALRILGSYALKQGEYPITSTETFRRYALMGNGVYNLRRQSFIVGKYLIPGVVIKSALYYNRLYERVRKALRRKQKITLFIVDAK